MCDRTEGLCLCVGKGRKFEPCTSDSRKQGLNQQEQDCQFTCKLLCCNSCSFCQRVSTKERCKSQLLLSLSKNKVYERCFLCRSLEYCKSCHNVPNVAPDLSVGARLHQFWEKWAALGASPKVTVLREDYTLPFWFRPNLTRSPTVISCFVNPNENLYLLEALHQLVNKNAVEPVSTQKSLGFYNRLFLVPKPNNWWRPIFNLSTLNNFLNT